MCIMAHRSVASLDITRRTVSLCIQVKDRGEVIKFVGNYAASKGQAAALVLYVFFGALLSNRAT